MSSLKPMFSRWTRLEYKSTSNTTDDKVPSSLTAGGRYKPAWRPWILRLPGVLLVSIISLVAIGLLEYAAQSVPVKFIYSTSVAYTTVGMSPASQVNGKRQETSSAAYSDYVEQTQTLRSSSSRTSYVPPPAETSTVPYSDYVEQTQTLGSSSSWTSYVPPASETESAAYSDYVQQTQTLLSSSSWTSYVPPPLESSTSAYSAYVAQSQTIYISSSWSSYIPPQPQISTTVATAYVDPTQTIYSTSEPTTTSISWWTSLTPPGHPAGGMYLSPTETILTTSGPLYLSTTSPIASITRTISKSAYVNPVQTVVTIASSATSMPLASSTSAYGDPVQTIVMTASSITSIAMGTSMSAYVDPAQTIVMTASPTTIVSAASSTSAYIDPVQTIVITASSQTPPSTLPSPSSLCISTPPAPTRAGTTPGCCGWYTVVGGDTCMSIAAEYSITLDQLQSWNTFIDESCDNLWADTAICISTDSDTSIVTNETPVLTTTTLPTKSATLSAKSSVEPVIPITVPLTIASDNYVPPTTTVAISSPSASADPSHSIGIGVTKVTTIVYHYAVWASIVAFAAPVAFAAAYKVIWMTIHRSVKLMEPFMMMSTTTGVQAENSLFTHYLSSTITPDTLTSYTHGHWRVFLTSLGYLLASVMAPLASEILFTDTTDCDVKHSANPDNPNPCPPELNGRMASIRVLQGLFACLALMNIVIGIVFFLRKNTGIYEDPSSISAVAALLHHPQVVEDFLEADPNASTKELKWRLGSKRYRLGLHNTSNGTFRHGIIPAFLEPKSESVSDRLLSSTNPGYLDRYSLTDRLQRNKLTPMLADAARVSLLLGLLAVIIAYYLDGSNSGFNRFFNSAQWGPRFIMTSVGAIIASQWQYVEREVQLLSVYASLARGGATAKNTIHVTRASTAFGALFPALLRKDFMVAAVAIVTILAEVLVISLAGIPFASGEMYWYAMACNYISMGILGLMILVMLGLMVWRLQLPYLPRSPDTVAAVISYVVGGKLVEDAHGTDYTGLDLGRDVVDEQRCWKYGRVEVQKEERWVIDEDDSDDS